MAKEEWSALMAAAQAGDRLSYRRLLTEIAPWVRAMAWRSLRDAAEAEDAVQDTLLTLHEMRHAYDPRRPFRPWLAGIARHRILDRRRRSGRRAAREVALAESHETIAGETTNTAMDACDGATVRRALGALSPGQRSAIEMMKLNEMSLQEASAASGMTVAALKVATHRALCRLRTVLGGAGV